MNPEPQGATVEEGVEQEVGKDSKPRKLPALKHAQCQPDCKLVIWLFFKPTLVKYLPIIYLEERINAPWRKAEKEGAWWQTAHILNCPGKYSFGPKGSSFLQNKIPAAKWTAPQKALSMPMSMTLVIQSLYSKGLYRVLKFQEHYLLHLTTFHRCFVSIISWCSQYSLSVDQLRNPTGIKGKIWEQTPIAFFHLGYLCPINPSTLCISSTERVGFDIGLFSLYLYL